MDKIETLLMTYDTFEDVLDVLDITPEQVINILLRHGYVSLPPFLDDLSLEYDDE